MQCCYVWPFASGRHALYAILKAMGIDQGDEVIVQAFTCVAVPNAVRFAGAEPVYVDISPNFRNTFGMDLTNLEYLLTDRTKAVIVQHTFGVPGRIREVMEICKLRGIKVIEDCSHSVGIRLDGKPLGSFGDAGFWSSDHTKMISTSTGGMAFTNDRGIAEELSLMDKPLLPNWRVWQIVLTFLVEVLLTHPRVYWFGDPIRRLLDKMRILYFFRDENDEVRPKHYPSTLSNAQAYIGVKQLEKLEENLKHREDLAKQKKYWPEGILREVREVRNPEYFIAKHRKYVRVGRWFDSPVFGCNDLARVGYVSGSCPIAESICKRIINFPNHPRIKEQVWLSST
jgi:dTDP-4-amino-4,6-dideoxygalactose transaminase